MKWKAQTVVEAQAAVLDGALDRALWTDPVWCREFAALMTNPFLAVYVLPAVLNGR